MDWFGFKRRREEKKRRREELKKKDEEREERENLKHVFFDNFGFSPSSPPSLWQQKLVDEVLTAKAAQLRKAYDEQTIIFRSPPIEKAGASELYRRKDDLQEAGMIISQCEEDFWGAHAAAKAAGFEVKPKHGDYLEPSK